MLKRATYENWGYYPGGEIPQYSEVVYTVFDGERCVFSGITPGPARTSTVNAAEAIITEICKLEGVSLTDYTFYDLQTGVGYQGWHFVGGQFAFDQISFQVSNEMPTDLAWHPDRCPPEVYRAFREQLGKEPLQTVGDTPYENLVRARNAHNN